MASNPRGGVAGIDQSLETSVDRQPDRIAARADPEGEGGALGDDHRTHQHQEEAREQPSGLLKIFGRRTSSANRSRSRSQERLSQVTTTESSVSSNRTNGTGFGGILKRTMSNSTEHTANGTAQHHHGLLDKVKGIYAQRPSSRDRSAGHHDDSHRGDGTLGADTERGRGPREHDPMVSTGRGGAGNIRAASRTRGPEETSEGELEAREKSRERSRERGHAAGRGGAGNFRSASRDPAARIREEEEGQQMARAEAAAQAAREAADANHLKSYGRGGAGNIHA